MLKKIATFFMCLFTSQSKPTVSLAKSYVQDGVVKTPSFPGISGEVKSIFVKDGSRIDAGASMLVIETSVATFEIPSPCSGAVKRVLTEPGAIVEEGTPLVELECT